MEKGNSVILNPDVVSNLKKNTRYVIEAFDKKHITKCDGPESIRNWLLVKLKGVNELQWAKDFILCN